MSTNVMAGGNKSWSDWVAAMAGHVDGGESRQFGSVTAASVGAPMELFNQAFVFEEPVVADVEAATAWLRERGMPFWVTAPGHLRDSLADLAPQLDLSRPSLWPQLTVLVPQSNSLATWLPHR